MLLSRFPLVPPAPPPGSPFYASMVSHALCFCICVCGCVGAHLCDLVGRLPGEPAEVTLQRTIGAKKDEFRLNRKHLSKTEVVNLLESAGFSRSNPYYIVRQGKVDRICKMSDRERLDLLKEVAGTKVYDDRKRQSDAIMGESKERRDQIDEILESVTDRLQELQQQKTELLEYQKLDKSHRALRYCIFNAEHEQTREKLAHNHADIEENKNVLADLNAQAAADAARIRQHEQAKENATHAVSAAERELARVEQETTELTELKQSLTIKASSLSKQIQSKENEEKELEKESAALVEEIEKAQKTIAGEVEPAHAKLAEAHKTLTKELQTFKTTQNTLNAKLNRHLQFSSEAERDAAYEEEIRQLEDDVAANSTNAKASQRAAAARKSIPLVLTCSVSTCRNSRAKSSSCRKAWRPTPSVEKLWRRTSRSLSRSATKSASRFPSSKRSRKTSWMRRRSCGSVTMRPSWARRKWTSACRACAKSWLPVSCRITCRPRIAAAMIVQLIRCLGIPCVP